MQQNVVYRGKKKKRRAFDRAATTNPERRKKKNTTERKREKGENRKQTFYLRDSFPFFSLCSTGIRRIGCCCRHRSRRKICLYSN